MQPGQSDEFRDTSPVNVSMEAALELEELSRGIRKDAPAFSTLVGLLIDPPEGFEGQGISMLADVRSFGIFNESLGQIQPKLKIRDRGDFEKVVSQCFLNMKDGVAKGDKAIIQSAKSFCLAFNNSLLAKEMSEIYSQRERSDARYISHESVS